MDNGVLQGIVERTKLKRNGSDTVLDEDSGKTFSDQSLVSMNCWGFAPNFMNYLGQRFSRYLDGIEDETTLQKGEFYLPAAVDDWRAEGSGEVKVLVSEESWLGVTYPEDKAAVMAGIQSRIEEGLYNRELWS